MIQIANAPCSWGVLEFDLEGEAAGYAQVLDEMQADRLRGHRAGRLGLHAHRPGQLESRDRRCAG